MRVTSGRWRIALLDSASGVGKDTNGHGHVGYQQLRWLRHELEQSIAAHEQVVIVVHQLLVTPIDDDGNVCSWFVPEYDLISNAEEVLALLHRFHHVRLVLHGHVHANSVTRVGGVPFVTTSSASEYPMMWREIVLSPCEIELRTHQLPVPKLLEQSALRDTRGLNEAKRGGALANHVVLPHCGASASTSSGSLRRHATDLKRRRRWLLRS